MMRPLKIRGAENWSWIGFKNDFIRERKSQNIPSPYPLLSSKCELRRGICMLFGTIGHNNPWGPIKVESNGFEYVLSVSFH